jgi:hypothetical protein
VDKKSKDKHLQYYKELRMSPVASIQAELVKGDAVAMQEGLPISDLYPATASFSSDKNGMRSCTPTMAIPTTTAATVNNNSDAQMEESELNDNSLDSVSLWEVVASFSMLLLWIQRYAFGFVALLPSLLLLSQICLRLCHDKKPTISAASNSITEAKESIPVPAARNSSFYLLQSILFGQKKTASLLLMSPLLSPSSSPPHYLHHKQQVSRSWPPPGLVVLAILTIVALIVHPDGMTWIVLRKIR